MSWHRRGDSVADLAASRTRERRPLIALLAGNSISLVGNELALIAIPWFVLLTTGSAARTGITAAVSIIPMILAGIFGGAIVDRLGFKHMSVIADVVSGLSVAAIPLLHRTVGLSFELLLVLVFVGALLDAPGSTARQSMLPDLAGLGSTSLERVNAAFMGVQRAAELVGPLLAGILVAVLGATNVLWIDAATFACSALLVAGLVPSRPTSPSETLPPTTYVADLAAGLRFIRGDRLLRSLIVIDAASALTISPIFAVILPVYANEVFGRSAYLRIMAAGFGAGALLGVTVYGACARRVSRRVILVGAFLALSAPLAVISLLPGIVLAVVTLVALGIARGPVSPLLMTVAQERTPASMRGRVFGLINAVALAALPLGLIGCGWLVEVIGLRQTLIGMTAAVCMLAVGVFVNPSLRRLDAVVLS
jgi:MFS family permease